MLIALPFRRTLHHKIMRVGLMIWLFAALQVAAVVLLVTFWSIDLVALNQLCQSPYLSDALAYPVTLSVALVYGLFMLAVCAVTCAIVVLIKRSLKNLSAHKARTNFKTKVMIKSVVAMIVNVIPFVCVLVVEVLSRSGYAIDIKTHLALTISIMSVNRLCNPWLYSFSQIKAIVQPAVRKQ
jgi:hypothetical protein